MIRSLDALGSEARVAVEKVLANVSAGVDPEYREAVLEDVRAYLTDHLDAASTVADVEKLALAVGDPGSDPADRDGWLGRLPIDLTPPTAEKVAHTWWNPKDERLFVPRVFGLGWSLNFGAAAVKLGLIEPDAEDEPFESTPVPALRAALVVPAVLAAAVGAHYLFRWRGLPDRLPSQLGTTGRVDGLTSKVAAASVDVAVATLPTLWAGLALARGATGARAAGSMAAATASASVAAGLAVWRTSALDGKAHPWAGPGLLALMWLPAGGLLLVLARLGRAAELRRDLGKKWE